MKKTLIALIALAGAATAATTIVDVEAVTSTTATASFSENTSKAITVALTINVEAYKDATDTTQIVKLDGTWELEKSGYLAISRQVGWTTAQGQRVEKDGIQAPWKYDTSTGNGNINQSDSFLDVDWDQMAGMAMVMTFNEGSDKSYMPFNTSVSLISSSGEVTTWTAEANQLFRFASGDSNHFVATGIAVNADLVESFTVYSGYLSATDSEALSKSLLPAVAVPEPTTATLSLLALAGLAARRRRK